jgi:CPA1 family monovalent cation:H+ antiporter
MVEIKGILPKGGFGSFPAEGNRTRPEYAMSTNVAVEFLIWMLIAASAIAVVANHLRIPYTVALVLGGLALGSLHLPLVANIIREQPSWLTPDVGLVVFLPPLLFEGSLKLQLRHLRENLLPILLFANAGVLAATVITGLAVHWIIGFPILVGLVFGAIISATDPISVLALFRDTAVAKRLSVLVEGESLLNDGTAAVLYGILVAAVMTGSVNVATGVRTFFVEVLGGAAVGLGLGYLVYKITARIDEPEVEITLTTVLAYGSFLVAQSLHLSGVIATVVAGLMIGNLAVPAVMKPQSRVSLSSFWDYASFVMNSIVFLVIGLEVHLDELLRSWQAMLLAAGAVLLGRTLSVYGLAPLSNLFTERIPYRWQHIMVWGGTRGALSLALALSLDRTFPYRNQVLAATFGVVAFSIVIQGLTIKPLLAVLGIGKTEEDEYRLSRARHLAISSARTELNSMLDRGQISKPIYEVLRYELDQRAEEVETRMAEIYAQDESRAADEIRLANVRLIAAEKSSIEDALRDGLISARAAAKLLEETDRRLDQLVFAEKRK